MVHMRASADDLTPLVLYLTFIISACQRKEVIGYEEISNHSDDSDLLGVVSRFSGPEHGRG
jgi:hypothetical protein